jgi:hypothetical protein
MDLSKRAALKKISSLNENGNTVPMTLPASFSAISGVANEA